MSHHHRLPLRVCISSAGSASSTLVLILMPLLIRLLPFAAPLHTWAIANRAQAVVSGTCASALTIRLVLAVDPNTVHYLMLIARAK